MSEEGGCFGGGFLDAALSEAFGQPMDGVSATQDGAGNEEIGADASCEGSEMRFNEDMTGKTDDPEAMELVAHEAAHALAGGGSGQTALDEQGDRGEKGAEDAGRGFRKWAESGFEGPAPALQPAAGGKAQVHRSGGGPRVTGRPYLKNGSVGAVVSSLQTLLNAVSGAGLSVDGAFGPRTAAAVRAFQAAVGAVVDGIVGPQTAGKLNEGGSVSAPGGGDQGQGGGGTEAPTQGAALTGDPMLSFNSRGAIVSTLQRKLNEKGASLAVDGVFGAGTDYAVRQFQRANGLGGDGIVGPATAAKINDPSSKDIPKGGAPGGGQSDFEGNEAYDTLRGAVIGAAESHMGAPYYWGGDGPAMFDCSGFVLYVLRQDTGLVSWGDDTAAGIKGRMAGTGNPKKGDPVFYRGSGGVSHIEFYMGSGSQTIGASGGGSRTFGNDPGAKVQYGDYSRDGRSKSFGSLDALIQAKLASSSTR